MMQKLYHYTDAKGARGIIDSNCIHETDGIYGFGVYLTTLGPTTGTFRLIQNNYDDCHRIVSKASKKVKYWFSFNADDFGDELEKVSVADQSVYFVGRDVSLNESSIDNNWTNFDLN